MTARMPRLNDLQNKPEEQSDIRSISAGFDHIRNTFLEDSRTQHDPLIRELGETKLRFTGAPQTQQEKPVYKRTAIPDTPSLTHENGAEYDF